MRHSFKPRLPGEHKYGAKAVVIDGMRFDSKLEGRWFEHFKKLREEGLVLTFTRQVPFHLPGSVRLVVDFQVFWADGVVSFFDVKGMETEAWKAKRRIAEELFSPIRIETLKRVPKGGRETFA